MSRHSFRIVAARWIWYLYGVCYLLAFFGGLQGTLITPLLASVPLVIASVLFALAMWPAFPDFVAWTMLAAILEFVLGILVLGGRGRLMIGAHPWDPAQHIPESVRSPAWIIGMLVPIVVMVCALREIRRYSRTVT